MEKRDLYNSQAIFQAWKTNPLSKGISLEIQKLLISYLSDMELGLNVAKVSKKGSRSYVRLNALRYRLIFLIKQLNIKTILDLKKLSSEKLHKLFSNMRTGVILSNRNEPFKSTPDYVKSFKAFWHWFQKKYKSLPDITQDLDTSREKPKFVYLTEEDFEKLLDKASFDLKPLIALSFDSGARDTELLNIKVSDFEDNFTKLNIREETSKTFGRKIKLMLCSEQIQKYVKILSLSSNDFLFQKSIFQYNKELRNLGKKFLKPEQIRYKNLTLYAFRHSSACFWLPRYKSESALMYRFGWKKSDMIHYYTEFLGMKDTITQDDLYLDITKTELEKRIEVLENIIKRYNKLFKNNRTLVYTSL